MPREAVALTRKFGETNFEMALQSAPKMCKILFRTGSGRGPATSKLLRLCIPERMCRSWQDSYILDSDSHGS